jgi:acyl-CoA reductase-like NAD-dependent aldehyde dehydrogenase
MRAAPAKEQALNTRAVVPNSTTPSSDASGQIGVVNPATGDVIATVAEASEGNVAAVVALARQAFPSWRATPAAERSAALLRFASALRADGAELAALLTAESGKTIVESEWDIAWTAEAFEFYAGLALSHSGRMPPPQTPTGTELIVKEPVGVVAAITPWNYPLLLWAWKAAPALAAGNCVIAKPPPETPLTMMRVNDMLGLPDGVHAVVNGGAETGQHLVEHPGVDLVAFTGTARAGKEVMRACADQVKRLVLELSGNDPMIVWDDVDLDVAVECACFAAFINAGQVCTSTERIYVRDTIAEEFTRRLAERASDLRIGDPADPGTMIGPVATEAQVERLEAYVNTARERGAVVHAGGARTGADAGFFFQPTVLSGVGHDVLRELGEIFGPIVPVIPVSTFTEAVELSNDSVYGLGANVLTSSLELALQAGRELRCGSVWINSPLIDNNAGPFGGFRQSGLGRELGLEGYEAYLETKHVTIEPVLSYQPWWFSAR